MKRFVGSRNAAALAVVGVVALAGCNGGGDDPTTSSSSVTSSATSTTTTTAPPTTTATPTPGVPAAARQKTKAGAEAFAAYFLGQVNEAWTTPDADLLEPLCLSTSKSCEAFKQTARDLESQSQRYRTSPVTIERVMSSSQDGNGAVVDLAVIQNKVDVINSDGSVALTDQRKLLVSQSTLTWVNAGWRVALVKGADR